MTSRPAIEVAHLGKEFRLGELHRGRAAAVAWPLA